MKHTDGIGGILSRCLRMETVDGLNPCFGAHLDEDIRTRGIEWLNVFAVDNVLQRIADPVFVGATILSGCVCGSKVVRKVSPYERVGAMCLEDGKPSIVEYYELTQMAEAVRRKWFAATGSV